MLIYYDYEQVVCLIAYAIIIAIAITLKILLKNKSEAVKKIPLYVIAGILVYLELMKQFCNILKLDYGNMLALFQWDYDGEFSFYALPFHFCSFFVVWALLQVIFIKSKSKIKDFIDNMAFLWASAITLLMLFYPELIYGDGVERLYLGGEMEHTVLFHLLVLLYWAIAVALRTYKFNVKKWWQAILAFVVYGALAIPAAFIFKENYCSILEPAGFTFLLPILEKGYLIYEPVLMCVGFALSLVIFFIICGAEKIRDMFVDDKLFIYGYIALIPLIIVLLLVSKGIGYDTLSSMFALILFLLAFICLLPAIIVNCIKKAKSKK